MKYLITVQRNAVQVASTEEWLALLKAHREHVAAQIEDGTIESVYNYVTAAGGFCVWNAESHEQVLDLLLAWPLFPFYDVDIKPVLEFFPITDKFIELFQGQLG